MFWPLRFLKIREQPPTFNQIYIITGTTDFFDFSPIELLNQNIANLIQACVMLNLLSLHIISQTEIESTKTELARELATLKKCLVDTASPELMTLRTEKLQLTAKVERLEKEAQARSLPQPQAQPDEKDQAVSDCFIKWFTCSVEFFCL